MPDISWFEVEQRHDGLDRCQSCGSLVFVGPDSDGECPACGGAVAVEEDDPPEVERIEWERQHGLD